MKNSQTQNQQQGREGNRNKGMTSQNDSKSQRNPKKTDDRSSGKGNSGRASK